LNFFKKIGIDPADLMTRSKPGIRILDPVSHRAEFKNYDSRSSRLRRKHGQVYHYVFFFKKKKEKKELTKK
jgi:hypothetical protein